MLFRHILVAYDGSKQAVKALEKAVGANSMSPVMTGARFRI